MSLKSTIVSGAFNRLILAMVVKCAFVQVRNGIWIRSFKGVNAVSNNKAVL